MSVVKRAFALGVGISLLGGLALKVVREWLPTWGYWGAVQSLLDIGFWLLVAIGSLLVVQSLGALTILDSSGRRPSRTTLGIGLGIAIGVVCAILIAGSQWVTFTGQPSNEAAFGSLVVSTLFGFAEITAGFLVAVGVFAWSGNRPGRRGMSAAPSQEATARSE